MQKFHTIRQYLLPGLLFLLFFLPDPADAGMSQTLIAPQENRSYIKLKRDMVTGTGPAVRVSPIPGDTDNFEVKINLKTRAHCNNDAYVHHASVYDRNHQTVMADPYQGKQSVDIFYTLVPVTTTKDLRRMCGSHNGTTTIVRSFDLTTVLSCEDTDSIWDSTVFGSEDGGYHTEVVSIPLKITCEDILAPEKISATVAPGQIEFKCPQITPYQPQSGPYFDMARIVVLGTAYAHLWIDASNDTQGRTCVRVWNSNNSGSAYISSSEQHPITGTQ